MRWRRRQARKGWRSGVFSWDPHFLHFGRPGQAKLTEYPYDALHVRPHGDEMRTFSAMASGALLIAGALTMQGCATSSTAAAYVSNADSKEISVLRLDRAAGTVQVTQTL